MKLTPVKSRQDLSIDITAVADLIVKTQKENGEIPWSDGDKTDPWDHVEAAIGLNIAGRQQEARAAFDWMVDHQMDDGSWYASYRDGVPEDRTKDTNMATYIAVGVFHDYLVNGDLEFLVRMWPTVKKAIDFAIGFQTPGGELHWASSPEGIVDPVALLTGSSSVFMSMKCALAAAQVLGHDMPHWKASMLKLGDAIRNRPHAFNMAKSRYSMDWFYPILCGAVSGADAQRRIDKYWDKYIVKGQGVLCVSDQPWVTMAETSEFILALDAMGNTNLARIVFGWIQDRCFDDGSYWCGFTCPDIIIWPEEKITWTNAVVLMAADALYNISPAGRMFNHEFWKTSEYSSIFIS